MSAHTERQQHLPAFARDRVNLASLGLGARAVSVTDEFFAPMMRMLQDSAPVFIPDKFDTHGKWMDGWETRRRRDAGHDHAVVALATRGRIDGFGIDTTHFTGNYAPAVRIEATVSDKDPDGSGRLEWVEILPTQGLDGDASHFFECTNQASWTHLRVHIYPDGGIARFRAYGLPVIERAQAEETLDLASALLGGRILAMSDAHYGDYQRLLSPGRGQNMGDGWETRRLRQPGHDWAVIALGARGRVTRALVDTAYFKGNYPDRCSIQAADLAGMDNRLTDAIVNAAMFWPELMAERPLGPDTEHVFEDLADIGPVTHVRLNILPDGGVSRLRLFGRLE